MHYTVIFLLHQSNRSRLTTIMKSLNSSCSVMSPRILVFASLILPFFVSLALAEVHYYDFIVKEVNFTRLCQNKLMLVVNESYPGPPIRARKGDTIYVNVYNEGFYGFTIHWHGVKQPRNPWFDGPEYVTQCPIAPGTNFTYQVQLSKEEGTVWWHAHSDWTRASVHGAIVVLPALGTTYPFPEPDEEEIIVFGSWYLGNLRERVEESLQPGSTETLPQSDAYTINGQPGDFLPCSINATWRRKVDHGKTYLLRLLNANIDAEFFFAIAEHNLTVVGLDGAYTKPINTRYIVVTPGQTMDVLLFANSTPGLYYMAGRQYLSTTSDTGFDHMNATAILQYNGNYTTTDAPLFPEHLPMYMSQAEAFNFTNQIRSLASPEHPVNVPKESDITTRMFITASMNSLYCAPDLGPTCVNISFATSVNNISWVNPTTDSILQAYYRNISNPIYETDFPDQPPTYFNFTDGGTTMSTVLTVQGTKVKVLDYNETVEIVFQGTNVMGGAVNHPMHLHGHSFYVLGFGFGPFDPVKDPKGYNLVDPPYVATFVTPKNGWLTIRFVADNPGVWFWHCHVDRHMTWGMEAAFIIKDGGTAKTSMLPPPAEMPSCDVPLDSAIRNYEALIEKQME